MPRICDYEGSQYRTEFWESQNRAYEDLAERIAIEKLLPLTGKCLLEVGAGFGRLVDMYQGYDQIILTDYARTQLEEAQRYLGHDDRFVFVVADIYNMPFVDSLIDTLVMVRVMHHIENVPQALQEIYRIVRAEGAAIIEHASKRHVKSVLRWLMGRQDWNPFSPDPHEFVELNIDFHPKWMREQFVKAGLSIQETRSVSYYRLPFLKRVLPAQFLATLDGLTQSTGRYFQFSPSIFLRATPQKATSATAATSLFQCPVCQHRDFNAHGTHLSCTRCGTNWGLKDGIYDFKTPLST